MLIAFCGNGRKSGKDAAADFVQEYCVEHELTFQRLAFADQVKLLAARALGYDDGWPDEVQIRAMDEFKADGRLLWWREQPYEQPEDTATGRDFIIRLAEGAKHLYGDEFWVDQILPLGWQETTDHTVITDLRFSEEANRVAEARGIVVQIIRPGAEDGRSEGQLSDLYIDGYLNNDRDLNYLRRSVYAMMDSLEVERLTRQKGTVTEGGN